MIDNSPSSSDKRHYLRQPITTYVELDEDNGGIIVDASEGGLRVQAVHELEAGCSIRMRFQPSPTSGWAEAKGRIIWTSQSKKVAGIEFCDLPDKGHQVLRGLLCEPSWPNGLNQGLDSAEPNATDRTSVAVTARSEVPRTDSAPMGRLDAEAAPLSASRAKRRQANAARRHFQHNIPRNRHALYKVDCGCTGDSLLLARFGNHGHVLAGRGIAHLSDDS